MISPPTAHLAALAAARTRERVLRWTDMERCVFFLFFLSSLRFFLLFFLSLLEMCTVTVNEAITSVLLRGVEAVNDHYLTPCAPVSI